MDNETTKVSLEMKLKLEVEFVTIPPPPNWPGKYFTGATILKINGKTLPEFVWEVVMLAAKIAGVYVSEKDKSTHYVSIPYGSTTIEVIGDPWP